jgi:hypothetical protein
MTHVAYCRVSSSDQNLDAQLAAVKTVGATKIFREKESGAYEAGAKTDRGTPSAPQVLAREPGVSCPGQGRHRRRGDDGQLVYCLDRKLA